MTARRALRVSFVVLWLLVAPARGEDVKKPVDPAALRAAATEALTAWDSGDAKAAAEGWRKAAQLDPDDAVLRYNLAVALEQAGDREGAREAYRGALTGDTGQTEDRTLFNLAGLSLEDAWSAAQLVRLPAEELAEQLKGQPGPDGSPLDGPSLQAAVRQLREQAVEQGLEASKDAVGRLRDLVRRTPAARDVVHNLELAQRARRELEKARQEQEQEKQQQKDQDQEGDQGDPDEDQDQQDKESEQDGSQDQQDEQGEDPQPSTGKDSEQESENQGDSPPDPKQLSKEEAQRLLDQLLEQAAQKAEEVREMRARAARRVPVERDW